MEKNKELIDGIIKGLQLVLRDSLTLLNGNESRLSTAPKQAEVLARTYSGRQLMAAMETLNFIQVARYRNMNLTLLLTTLCAKLRTAVGR